MVIDQVNIDITLHGVRVERTKCAPRNPLGFGWMYYKSTSCKCVKCTTGLWTSWRLN